MANRVIRVDLSVLDLRKMGLEERGECRQCRQSKGNDEYSRNWNVRRVRRECEESAENGEDIKIIPEDCESDLKVRTEWEPAKEKEVR